MTVRRLLCHHSGVHLSGNRQIKSESVVHDDEQGISLGVHSAEYIYIIVRVLTAVLTSLRLLTGRPWFVGWGGTRSRKGLFKTHNLSTVKCGM